MEGGAHATQAAWLTCQAQSLRRTSTLCDETCLEVGAHLGDAIPSLTELSLVFTSLSQSLNGSQLEAAKTDLFDASGRLRVIGEALSNETTTFDGLIGLNKAIEARIASVAEYLRMISALVFNIKIEAVSLAGDNMMDFADNLRRIVNSAQAAFDEYQKSHLKLYSTLRNAFETQASFQKSHQKTLASVPDQIAEQLEAVDKRRQEVATALADLGTRSHHIGAQISQAVFALQIGDGTRQRIEHVHDALELVSETIKGHKDPWAADIGGSEQQRAVLSAICVLQADQLEGAAADFESEMVDIGRVLQSLNGESVQLGALGRELFGSGNKASDSFLGSLEQRLKAVHVITKQYGCARAVVDGAGEAIVTIVNDLNDRTEGLSSIISDMTLLGMNAILKSGRAGAEGRGFNTIAQELHTYATKVVQGIRELPPSLAQVSAAAEQLNSNGRSHNAVQMAELAQRMEAAIASVGTNGSDMSAALDKLDREGTAILKIITQATTRLSGHSNIGRVLADVLGTVRSRVHEIGNPTQIDDAGYEKIDQLLYAKYTMQSERDIHRRLRSAAGGGPSVVSVVSPKDELADFLL